MESNVDKRATLCQESHAKNILLDTGAAAQIVVARELVDTNSFTGDYNAARDFNGIRQSFPLEGTSERVDGVEHNLELLVADYSCCDALLGRDVPEL